MPLVFKLIHPLYTKMSVFVPCPKVVTESVRACLVNCFVTYASSVTVRCITRVTKSYDSPIHYSQVAEAEDDKETADSVGTKVENVKMVKKAAFAFKKKKNLKSSKKKKKHRLGSVVEQIMRKRRAEEAGGRPSTKQGSGSDKVSQ